MASFKYFADLDGDAIELANVYHDGSISTAAKHFIGHLPDGRKVRATRAIRMKANPRRHECDTRCMNATGRTMNCECSCGGQNHGRANFMCSSVDGALS